jgi:DNA repair exonuclease SbcCD ATPase subunit
MLTFRSVSFKNFLSTGDMPITILLDQSPTTLIVGANGAGKSTMLDAICFGLFGKPHRDIKNPQLINSVNGKNCEVQIEFTVGQDKYRVVRGYKPSIFEIWKNGILLNQESHSRDYQVILESSILKMNKKSFNQIVVLGAGNFVPFMQMPIWDRRGVIEELLDISVFSDMNTLIKEKLAKSREDLKDTENQLGISKEKVSMGSKHLNDLKQIEIQNDQGVRTEIQDLEVQYNSNFGRIEKELGNADMKQRRFDGFDSQIRQNLNRIRKEYDFYSKNDSCPTCEQGISKDLKNSRIETSAQKISEFETGLKQLAEGMTSHAPALSGAREAAALMKSIRAQIKALNQKLQMAEKKVDTHAAEIELEANRIELNRLTEQRMNQIDERAYLDVIQEMLRDTGIKAKIIKQYVPLMNKFINQYLSVLDFFVSFTLDDSFNETIRSRHRDDFSYASFSEGEKMRINLAILFTWRQIAKLKNHNATNLLILDETFDSSLDGDGVENLLRILNTLTATNVFVITHKPDSMVDKMASKLEFAKFGNFSTLKA